MDNIPSPEEIEAAMAEPAARPKSKTAPAAELPPHDIEAEQGVLGCILLDPGASMDLLSEQLSRAGGEAFYDLRHRALYEVLAGMWDRHVQIDLITVKSSVDNDGKLDMVGGLTYLATLQDAPPSAAHLPHYTSILIEKWTARNLIRLGHDIVARVKQFPGTMDALVADIQTDALKLTDGHVKSGPKRGTEILCSVYEQLEKAMRGRQEITGLKTGLHYLDNMTCGLQAGEMVVIGARPSVGKTALGVSIAVEVLRAGNPTLFFSVEMADVPIMHRFVGVAARVDTRTIRNGFLSETAKKRLTMFQAEANQWMKNLFVETRSAINGLDVFVTTRRMIREHGIKLVVVDYLQLMEAVNPSDSRVNDVAEISRWVKRTAKDLGVAVVAMAQLNRESAKARNAKPTMADLRESGQIEQDADAIGLLYRPEIGIKPDYHDMKWIVHHEPWCPKEASKEKADSDDAPKGWFNSPKITLTGPNNSSVTYPEAWRTELDLIRLDVAKNRQGETGQCDLVFQKRATAFVDAYRPDYGKKHQQGQFEGTEI